MKTYDISDFQLAVTLYTLGHKLVDVDSSNPYRAVLKFAFDANINSDAHDFFQDKLKLNPRHVLSNTRLVKDRIHAGV